MELIESYKILYKTCEIKILIVIRSSLQTEPSVLAPSIMLSFQPYSEELFDVCTNY